MANEATNVTAETKETASQIPNGLELLAQIELKRNQWVEAFVADIEPVREAFAKRNNQFKRKKPVNKISDDRYEFEIGKLGQGVVKSPSEGADILQKLISAARNDSDTEFRARIEQAYNPDWVEPETTPVDAEKPQKRAYKRAVKLD
ncbi:hypothetical protein CN165_12760 [Sinorhizobium medicae]|uniref:hypothetical protein n=1 Tax=Sinorhizobium medicae TaxID=110321 RepID=UPI000FD8DE50|nr:hypothetical protein [Sinorhizobium medicae]RVK19433.1 hypothetical protein CN165_12760 [Sinorhizobium medicae]